MISSQESYRPQHKQLTKAEHLELIQGSKLFYVVMNLRLENKSDSEIAAKLHMDELQLKREFKVSQKCRDKMILHNQGLAIHIAKRYANLAESIDLNELVDEGVFGLDRAIELFDPAKGFTFSTYSYRWIRHFILRAIENQDRMIRLPNHLVEKRRKIIKAAREAQVINPVVSLAEVAQRAGIEESSIRALAVVSKRPLSINWKRKGQDSEFGDYVGMPSSELSPDKNADRFELSEKIQQILQLLSKDERRFVELKFGLTDLSFVSNDQIKEMLGVSHLRFRAIQRTALAKLRKPSTKNILKDYLEDYL